MQLSIYIFSPYTIPPHLYFHSNFSLHSFSLKPTRELAAGGVKPDVFFGFRDKPYCMEEYRSIAGIVKVSTDTGAVGFHGFVTQLYDPADYDVVLVCGPTVMMRNAARLCAEKGTPCFVSLEKKMACGIGACLGCTCETRSGEGKSVCKNGPVFDAAEVF